MDREIKKVFNSGNKLLEIIEYDGQKPDVYIESQDYGGCEGFEIDSKEQLKEIIQHLQVALERWRYET
jgi:hypothetical protein